MTSTIGLTLPRLKSRVRIPCPALQINKFAAVVGGFFNFWVFGCVQGSGSHQAYSTRSNLHLRFGLWVWLMGSVIIICEPFGRIPGFVLVGRFLDALQKLKKPPTTAKSLI